MKILDFYLDNGATIPGVGTFYDFHNRLWLADNNNLLNTINLPKEKLQNPKSKEKKATPVEKVTVEDLFRKFEKTPPSDIVSCVRLWEISHTFFFRLLLNKTLYVYILPDKRSIFNRYYRKPALKGKYIF